MINKLSKSPLLKSTFKLSSSNLVSFLAVFIFTPIISRIYSPEVYSGWGVFSNVTVIFNIIIFLSYHNAIVQTKDDSEVTGLTVLCICCALIVNLGVTSFFLFGEWLNIRFFVNFPSIGLLSVYFLLYTLYYLSTAHANRNALYGLMATVTVVYGLTQPLLRIGLGYVYLSDISLIYACLIALLISALFYLVGFRKKGISMLRDKIAIKDILSLAKKYRKYPLYEAPASVLDSLSLGIVIIILSVYFEKKYVGGLSMVMQLIVLPISIVGNALSQISFRELSVAFAGDAMSANNEHFSSLTHRLIKICSLLSILPILFFVFGGDYVLVWLLGDEWQDAGKMSLCLSIFSVPVILTTPLLPIFKVVNKQDVRFVLSCIGLLGIVISIVLGVRISHNIYVVLILYSITYALTKMFLFYYEVKLMGVKLSFSWKVGVIIILTYLLLSVRIFVAL